jgi:hypothetical protein
MARARNIKPSIFKNELLGEADPLLTIVFIGLWCLADREGRLEDRPKRIKAEILPYRDLTDFNGYLTVLERMDFIQRYEVDGEAYIQVTNFKKHQAPHKTERASEIPEPPAKTKSCPLTVKAPLSNGSDHVKESLIPDSLIPDSLSIGRSRAEPKKSARKPDVVFEAIANACGIDWKALTKNERGALNNAAAQLREINATPDDIQARAAKYRQKWPGIDLTPMALVNNWNTVIAAPEQAECQIPHLSAPPHMKQDEYEMLDRRGKLAAYKRWTEIWEQRKRQANATA